MTDFIQNTIREQYERLEPHIRLVVVHPNYVPQHLVLAALGSGGVYVRLEGNNLSYGDLKTQLEAALAQQMSGISLSAVERVIMDECDRAESGDLDQFLVEIVAKVESGRVVLLTRSVPECVLDNTALRSKTRFIPSDSDIMMPDYSRRVVKQKLLEVRALGQGRALMNGRSITDWDGALPRSLFFFVVDRGMVRRDDIFKAFWPKLSQKDATNVFHVTKRKITTLLGVDLLHYWSGGLYGISPHVELFYDVTLFSEMLQKSAIATPSEAWRLLTRAIWLYRGDFLTSINGELIWVQERRRELAQSYQEALSALDNAGKAST